MLLWGGQLGSWLGTEVSGIAIPLIVLALTGSPAQAGAVAGVRGLVYVVWAIPAGVALDRFDRKALMVVANLGSCLALASIALALALGRLTIPHLLIASAVEGSCFVVANLGRFAAYPRVVKQEQLPAAAAQFGTADQLALIGGPPLGGFLYGIGGGAIALGLDACSYALNALAIRAIAAPLNPETPPARRSVRAEVGEALVWLWRQPILRFLNLLTAGRTLVVAGLYLLVVVLAGERRVPSLAIGLVFAFGAGGGLATSLVAARLHRRFAHRPLLIGTTAVSLLACGLYAVASNVAALAAVTALYFAADTLYYVITGAYSAKVTPAEIRGRVTSLTRLAVLGAHSLGFFLCGLLLQTFGGGPTIGALAAVLLVLFLATVTYRGLGRADF